MEQDFDTAFTKWLAVAQKISDDYMSSKFPNLSKPKLTFQRGLKRIKVIRENSVHCFVDIATGDVLKAATFQQPAKHARGNIYDESRPGVDQYGGLYLRK